MYRRYLLFPLLAASWFIAPAGAQDLEPRSYSNLPVGQNFAGVGYGYSDGEISPSPGVSVSGLHLA